MQIRLQMLLHHNILTGSNTKINSYESLVNNSYFLGINNAYDNIFFYILERMPFLEIKSRFAGMETRFKSEFRKEKPIIDKTALQFCNEQISTHH